MPVGTAAPSLEGMRVLSMVVCGLLGSGAVTTAEADSRVRVAAVTTGGSSAVYYGGQRVWRARRRGERVITNVLSSTRRGAVAFATRSRRGRVTLVVVLVAPDVRGHVMTWPIPRRTRRRGRPTVMWLGTRKVGFGYSAVRPAVVASWRVRLSRR